MCIVMRSWDETPARCKKGSSALLTATDTGYDLDGLVMMETACTSLDPPGLPQLLLESRDLNAGKHSTPSPQWEKGKRRCRHWTACSIPFALFSTAERNS